MRQASSADLARIVDLLAACALPTDDLDQQDLSLFIVDDRGAAPGMELGAVGGLERCGDFALLRSLATSGTRRGQGKASSIVDELEALAAGKGIRELFLLTETAAEFFAGLGYSVRERVSVPDAVRGSRQFSSICPDSATVMGKRLSPGRKSTPNPNPIPDQGP